MRRVILAAFAAACAARCFGLAASQAWVEAFVSNYVAQSVSEVAAKTVTETAGGVTTVTVPGGGVLTMEEPTDYALRVVASSAASATNGALLVWNGAGEYVSPSARVSCTATNMVFEGVGSAWTNGLLRFGAVLDAEPVRIQPSAALAATNGVKGVAR